MFCINCLHRISITLCFFVVGSLAGCSSETREIPETVPVKGAVLFKGEPVKGASVVFYNPEIQSVNATINATTNEMGQFELKSYFGPRDERNGVVPGTYKVTILKMVPPGKMTEEEYQAKVTEADKIVSAGGVLTQAQTPPELTQMIPRQYSDVTVSKLEAKVDPEQDNHFQFDLK